MISTPQQKDTSFTFTTDQLLANALDVDGDELSVLNLKVAEGQGTITDNNDGTWTFKPSTDWQEVEFSYLITNGSHGKNRIINTFQKLSIEWDSETGLKGLITDLETKSVTPFDLSGKGGSYPGLSTPANTYSCKGDIDGASNDYLIIRQLQIGTGPWPKEATYSVVHVDIETGAHKRSGVLYPGNLQVWRLS